MLHPAELPVCRAWGFPERGGWARHTGRLAPVRLGSADPASPTFARLSFPGFIVPYGMLRWKLWGITRMKHLGT